MILIQILKVLSSLNDAKDTVVNRFLVKRRRTESVIVWQKRIDDLKAAKVSRIKSYVTMLLKILNGEQKEQKNWISWKVLM